METYAPTPKWRAQAILLAHLSRRLIIPMTQTSVVRQHFQTSSPLKLLGQLKSSYADSLGWGKKVCLKGPGYMTKMATTPIYGKNPLKIFFSRTRRLMTLGLGM